MPTVHFERKTAPKLQKLSFLCAAPDDVDCFHPFPLCQHNQLAAQDRASCSLDDPLTLWSCQGFNETKCCDRVDLRKRMASQCAASDLLDQVRLCLPMPCHTFGCRAGMTLLEVATEQSCHHCGSHVSSIRTSPVSPAITRAPNKLEAVERPQTSSSLAAMSEDLPCHCQDVLNTIWPSITVRVVASTAMAQAFLCFSWAAMTVSTGCIHD